MTVVDGPLHLLINQLERLSEVTSGQEFVARDWAG